MPSLTRSGSPLLPSSNRRRRSSSFSICATPRVNTYSTDSRVGCCFTVTTKPSRIGLIVSLPHCSRIGVSRRGGKGVGRHLEIMLVILRCAQGCGSCAQDDREDSTQVRSREVLSPNVWGVGTGSENYYRESRRQNLI